MAHVYGRIEPGSLKQEITPIAMLLGIAIAVVSCIFWSKGNATVDWSMVVLAGVVLTGFLFFAYGAVHHRPLLRIFKPSAFRRTVELDRRLVDQLRQLDDNCFVFNHFIFELCRVEHLLISPGGIFVIAKVEHRGEVSVVQDTLFIGGRSLETMTGNSWRACHLINIILKKWFATDYMPQPVLAIDSRDEPDVPNYDGIIIVRMENLSGLISQPGKAVEQETARSFARFVGDRYVKWGQ